MSKQTESARAVLYARVSSDDAQSDGRGLAGQLELCRDFARERGYTVVAELSEDARRITSGADWNLPEINRALEMARAGEIDAVITRELDRFARDLGKQLFFENEFNRFGAQVIYVLEEYDDTPEGQLTKNIRGVIAEYERVKIKQRMARGRDQFVKAGGTLCGGAGAPYGYDLDNNRLKINEETAKHVKRIFEWFIGGMSLTAIADKMMELDIAPPGRGPAHEARRGKRGIWTHATVRLIVKNQTYTGVWHYGKRTGREDKPAAEVPALISREVYEASLERFQSNIQQIRRNHKHEYLLAGRSECSVCGANIIGKSAVRGDKVVSQSYCCITRHYGRKSGDRHCTLPYFNVRKTDPILWNWVKKLLSEPDHLKDKLLEYQTGREEIFAPIREQVTELEKLIEKNRRKRSRWLEMRAEGEISKEELKEAKAPLDRAIASLEKQLTRLSAQLQQGTISTETIDNVLAFAERVSGNLGAMDSDFDEKHWLFGELHVTSRFVMEDGQRVVYASCMLTTEEERLSINDTKLLNSRAYGVTLTERLVIY